MGMSGGLARKEAWMAPGDFQPPPKNNITVWLEGDLLAAAASFNHFIVVLLAQIFFDLNYSCSS